MKEASFKDCIDNFLASKVSEDIFKINSLTETSKARIVFLETLEIKDNNVNFIFEGYYSSLLEVLHAIILKNGYKINNHICLGYFLRDILKREDLYILFEDCRYKRNSLVYYGKIMDVDIAIKSLKLIKDLIKKLENIK